MPHGFPDYTFFSYPLSVFAGGTGLTSLTLHGVVLGQGTSSVVVTAAGAAYQSLSVPAAGGDPAFSAVALDQAAAVSGLLPVTKGGTGVAACVLGSELVATGANTAAFQAKNRTLAWNSANQSIPNGATTSLLFDTNILDNGGLHSTTVNKDRITIQTAGYYLCMASAEVSLADFESYNLLIAINDTNEIIASAETPQGAAGATDLNVVTLRYLNPGDYIKAYIYQATGGAVNSVSNIRYSPTFGAQWMGF